MLKLSVTSPDADLRVDIDYTEGLRCPFAWGFLIWTGPPEDARVQRGLTLSFAHGYAGAAVESTGPVELDIDHLEHEGGSACAHTDGMTVNFPDVPEGVIHFLHFTAGTPFESVAVLSSPMGGVEVVDAASGEGSHYLTFAEFESAGSHVVAHNPGYCAWPNADPASGFCEPGYQLTGGTKVNLDVADDLSARFTFDRHPYFRFGCIWSSATVSNLTVTDPLGRVRDNSAHTDLSVAGYNVRDSGAMIGSGGSNAQYPPGTYVFDVHASVAVGAAAPTGCHAFGVDYHFPDERAAGAPAGVGGGDA